MNHSQANPAKSPGIRSQNDHSMDDVKQLLDLASSHFNAHRETIQKINNDPVVRQWFNLDFEAHSATLSFYNIKASSLINARSRYIDLDKKISAQSEQCENELGNLTIEVAHQTGNNTGILAQLNEMRVACGSTTELIRQFSVQAQVFRDADAAVRSKLTFNAMISLARSKAGNKAEMFNTGYELYSIATTDETQPKRESRLNELYSKAKEIEGAFERLELPNLPGIALQIIKFHIEKAMRAAQMITNFVAEANRILFNEIAPIKALHTEIERCNKQEIHLILAQSPALIQTLSKTMIALNYLGHIRDHLRFFSGQLNDLKLLHRVLRLDLLPDLAGKINSADSLLNPAAFAGRKANHFFSGIPGLLRTLKMLLTSLSGKKVVSDIELQNKIADAISHCPLYFSKQPDDILKMEQFVNGYIGDFAKPFPYDSLYLVMKASLAEYGDRLEYFLDDYKINPERAASSDESATADGNKPPANVKNLLKRIEKRLTTEIKI